MKFPKKMLHPGHLRFGIASVAALGLLVAIPGSAQAAAAPVPLGTADSFVVLAGTTVTNTGATTLNGDIGLAPGSSITGMPPLVLNGASHMADTVALSAQAALGPPMTTPPSRSRPLRSPASWAVRRWCPASTAPAYS